MGFKFLAELTSKLSTSSISPVFKLLVIKVEPRSSGRALKWALFQEWLVPWSSICDPTSFNLF